MILREIKNIFIKNRLTEGVDFKRYEWLKADIPLNVTMMELPVNSNNVEYDLQRLAHGNTTIFKTKNNEYKYFFWQYGYTIGVYDLKGYRDVTSKSYDSTISLFHIKTTPNSVAFNSVSIGAFGLPITNILWQVNSGSANDITITSSIKVDGVTRYVPCQLLKSIPATLDANNIARSAGECGMYDSITGKFYGNIANSGTFTVKGDVEPETHTGLQQIYQNKLIEGGDYQTYEWLKADIPPNNGSMMFLPISSRNFEFKRNFIQLLKNSGYFKTSGSNTSYLYFIDNYATDFTAKFPKIFEKAEGSVVYYSTYIGLGIHTIIANDNGVTISGNSNTASLPWYGSPEGITFYNVNDVNGNTIHLTSSIKVDDVVRYVPCQLLRSIPRNLDAQCKERVAGECGMIDLISGKFYGNVASCGTFTVENDSNE